MNAIIPETLPVWGWASLIVSIMLTYSELGGLKAIIYADAIQGLILLTVTVIIAAGFVLNFGGIVEMFEAVRVTNEALLSVPGPEGLFTTQFLVASFVAIVLVSITQPQMTIRLVIMRDLKSLQRIGAIVGFVCNDYYFGDDSHRHVWRGHVCRPAFLRLSCASIS